MSQVPEQPHANEVNSKTKKKTSKHKHAQKSPATSVPMGTVAMGNVVSASTGQSSGSGGSVSVEHAKSHMSRQSKASGKKHGDKTAAGRELASVSMPSAMASLPSQAALVVVAKGSAATERGGGGGGGEGLMRGFHPVKTVAADPVLTARGEGVAVEGGMVNEVSVVQNQVEGYHRRSR